MCKAVIDREELTGLVIRFTDAFNRDDLDGVMAYFADDAIYDEFNGKVNRGKAEIRAAFEPQFRGAHGVIRFHTEDVFVETDTGKALIRWRCTLERDGRTRAWQGLDILRFRDGLVEEKRTYAKASVPLFT